MKNIADNFPITAPEFEQLRIKFGNLVHFAAWQLLKKNAKNNHTDEFDDIEQNLLFAVIRAGCYTKRQTYIENCLKAVTAHCKDEFHKQIIVELDDLWLARTKHGANRQKFGVYQEKILETLVQKFVPEPERPDRAALLVIDARFAEYCKKITWNQQKTMGKVITRERAWRSGLVSLSEFSYLGSN